ncbi:hypothetical protein ACFSRY_02740 [Pontibacter locisalis]|uniref:Lipoprotein n=1 Tax=Pontibacter locisalis TaxID=1719035 RepID=A0ABW5IGI9_9BACT
MKTLKNIFKTSTAIAFLAVVSFGCGQQDTDIDEDTGTAEAIVEGNPAAANLNEPRPAPIGDTSETAQQANRFGEMSPNQDSAARAMEKLDERKRRQNQ